MRTTCDYLKTRENGELREKTQFTIHIFFNSLGNR